MNIIKVLLWLSIILLFISQCSFTPGNPPGYYNYKNQKFN